MVRSPFPVNMPLEMVSLKGDDFVTSIVLMLLSAIVLPTAVEPIVFHAFLVSRDKLGFGELATRFIKDCLPELTKKPTATV